MLIQQNAVLSALRRAQPFLTENASALTAVDLAAAAKRLDDIITSFTTVAVDQDVNDRGTKGESAKQQQLRVQLTSDLIRPIAEIARRDLRLTPEFKALRMPRRRLGGPGFVASAKGMAEAAAVHQQLLIERGMPADFLTQFQAAVAELDASVTEREQSRLRRMGATKALAFQEQEGRSVLKVLDALVRRALRGNAALLGMWAGARAIHRRPGGPGTTSTSAPTTPATTTETQVSTPTEAASTATAA